MGWPDSTHLSVVRGTVGLRVLGFHRDPYPVIALHLSGIKEWNVLDGLNLLSQANWAYLVVKYAKASVGTLRENEEMECETVYTYNHVPSCSWRKDYSLKHKPMHAWDGLQGVSIDDLGVASVSLGFSSCHESCGNEFQASENEFQAYRGWLDVIHLPHPHLLKHLCGVCLGPCLNDGTWYYDTVVNKLFALQSHPWECITPDTLVQLNLAFRFSWMKRLTLWNLKILTHLRLYRILVLGCCHPFLRHGHPSLWTTEMEGATSCKLSGCWHVHVWEAATDTTSDIRFHFNAL